MASLEGCDVVEKGRPVELPVRGRTPQTFERLLKGFYRLRCSGRVVEALVVRCTGLAEKLVVCVGRPRLRYAVVHVYDRLSGLRLRLRAPILELDDCSIRATWAGTTFVIDCGSFETCSGCTSVTPRDRLYRSLL